MEHVGFGSFCSRQPCQASAPQPAVHPCTMPGTAHIPGAMLKKTFLCSVGKSFHNSSLVFCLGFLVWFVVDCFSMEKAFQKGTVLAEQCLLLWQACRAAISFT